MLCYDHFFVATSTTVSTLSPVVSTTKITDPEHGERSVPFCTPHDLTQIYLAFNSISFEWVEMFNDCKIKMVLIHIVFMFCLCQEQFCQ